jgi:hypothetical protein
MLHGMIVLDDHTIIFDYQKGMIKYTVKDTFNNESESFIVTQDKFCKALAIAMHPDGMPDAEKDYPDAESIQGKIRWIP